MVKIITISLLALLMFGIMTVAFAHNEQHFHRNRDENAKTGKGCPKDRS